ncbi:MAG: lipocalin family protein [Pseudomonadales bacterium]
MKTRTQHLKKLFTVLSLLFAVSGCASYPENPMRAVTNVDIDRFMGDWYVIANIPTFIEKGATNPIENYQRDEDGNIATTFTFEKNGRQKTMTMTAFVHEAPDNGIWDMQFVWPFRADYRIIYLDADYQTTIIGRNKRDYLWIMSRASPRDREAVSTAGSGCGTRL